MAQQIYMTDTLRLGKKGQVTIPKKIRDIDNLRENDTLVVTHMPGGEIMLRKKVIGTPEDMMLDAIRKAPDFNFEKAWREVLEDRKRERS
ncbi:AbrB/MazE/SpoVT family DNA-binding domain-containing protein [Candidatus Woesearchaeota archaeon]|nr:AbrB/MazE/SpoVT family DNA-binding domain-containing protein [Candidatus Woesearchaeota archaeon]